MKKNEILKILKQFKKNNQKKYNIITMGVFGSVARGDVDVELNEGSDVDVVVKIKKQDLFVLIGIKQDLEDMLSLPVDIISYRANMNQFLKGRIDEEAVYV